MKQKVGAHANIPVKIASNVDSRAETGCWRGRSIGTAVMLALSLATAIVAQNYSFRSYGAAQGLQNLVVLSLTQDRSGYIWAGTEGGLYRYDGTHFQLMGLAQGLPCSSEAHGLFVARDGGVWVNICDGMFRYDGGRFQAIPGVNTMLRGTQTMADSAGGGVLITTPTGLYEVSHGHDGSFSTRSHPLPPALAGKPMHGILRQSTRLWFGCDQQLCMEEAGQVSVIGPEQGLPEDDWDGIQIPADGSVWVRSPKSVYVRTPGQTRFLQEKPDIASSGFWGAMTLGRDGSLLVPTDQGLAIHTAAGWSVVNRQRGLRNERTAAVLEDREGSIWIGLVGAGVARWLGRGVWESWTVDHGLPSDLIWAIRRDRKGALWVGTGLGLARLDDSGETGTRTWTRKDGLGGDNVRWLAETPDGSIWAAMKPGGLARIDPTTGKIHLAGEADGLPCGPEDVFVDRRGRLWVPTACGVFRNDQPTVSNQFIQVATPESLFRGTWKVMEDANETMWFTNREGLWSLRGGQWRKHSRADGLLSDNPYVMALATDGSIWLRHRYDAGVERVEVSGDRIVRSTAVVPADPTSVEVTAFHGFDAFGNFWRGGANGVAVRHGNSWTTFTREDGLVWDDCDGEAFWADADGSVWLGTSGGLSHYRPTYNQRSGGPPAPLSASPIIARLDFNQPARTIRAEFSSLNYKAEQLVRFAYRLDEGPWTDSVERNVSITGLGPGTHRLEVRSRVRDGPLSTDVATSEFRVEPTWRETWWARLLAVALGAGAVGLFLWWRLRGGARRQTALEKLVAARTENLSAANRALDEKADRLRSSEDRLRLLFQQTPAGIFLFDRDLKVTECNEQFQSLLHFGSEAGAGMHLSKLQQAEILPAIQAALAGREGSYEGPCTLSNGFGCSWMTLTTKPLWDENRQVKSGIGLALDITERKRAEATLRESEERFRNMADTAPVMIWVTDQDKGCSFANKRWLEFTGHRMEQELGDGWVESVHPDDRELCLRKYSSAFDARRRFRFEFRLRRADGEYRLVLNHGAPCFASGDVFSGYIGSSVDITDLKRAQDEMLVTQKLESLGVLTSGIAHDFNNFLGSILAQAELAEAEVATGSVPRDEIHAIQTVAAQAAEVVRELMIYAGQDKGRLAVLDVSLLVEEMQQLHRVSISKHAVLKTELGKDLPAVLGNATQIRQMAMNLILNASEAIGEKDGQITVTTSRLATPGSPDFLRLEVSDTGPGMTEDAKSRIFDPFYTTKFAGRGLGLSVVQGIVRAHGGVIHVTSTPGKGTTFEILLPSTVEPAIQEEKGSAAASVVPGPNQAGTVLLVEDEEMLRLSVAEMLRRQGFSVIQAADGSSALEVLGASGKIDLILLDMTIPGASSREVIAEALRIRPDAKILLTSAYSRETVTQGLDAPQIRGFLRKPFRFDNLIQLLTDTMSS